MAFDERQDLQATDLIAQLGEGELAAIIKQYGQERRAKTLARAIKKHPGPLTSTGELGEIIRSVVGDRYFIKTASRVFQAIRIKVNNELEGIKLGLESTLPMLTVGGRVAVISYHSLEDGVVKRTFKKYSGKCVCPPGLPECRCGKQKLVKPVVKKPIEPEAEEIEKNPRARSAKLRVVERIETTS